MTATMVGAADLMSVPPRFSRGFALGGKVHALVNDNAGDEPNGYGRLVETVCGRTGPFAGLWAPESWDNIVKGGFACSNCVRKVGS